MNLPPFLPFLYSRVFSITFTLYSSRFLSSFILPPVLLMSLLLYLSFSFSLYSFMSHKPRRFMSDIGNRTMLPLSPSSLPSPSPHLPSLLSSSYPPPLSFLLFNALIPSVHHPTSPHSFLKFPLSFQGISSSVPGQSSLEKRTDEITRSTGTPVSFQGGPLELSLFPPFPPVISLILKKSSSLPLLRFLFFMFQ